MALSFSQAECALNLKLDVNDYSVSSSSSVKDVNGNVTAFCIHIFFTDFNNSCLLSIYALL